MVMPSTHTRSSHVPAGLGKANVQAFYVFAGFKLLLGITIYITPLEKTRPELSSAAVSAAAQGASVDSTEVNRIFSSF